MLAFYLNVVELCILMQEFNPERYFIDPFLGFLGAPDTRLESNEMLISEMHHSRSDRNKQSKSQLKDFLQIFDLADITIYSKIIRPEEKYPALDIALYPPYITNSRVLDFLPTCHIIRSITGRSAQINFSVIHDEDTYLFIAKETQYGNMKQIQELLYHSLGKESALIIDPINIKYQQSQELSTVSSIPANIGLCAKDTHKINELLSYQIVQKATLLIRVNSFTKSYASPIALGVTDFAEAGRIISKPYESFDGSVWLKYLSGTEDELVQALYEAAALLEVDWFTYQR